MPYLFFFLYIRKYSKKKKYIYLTVYCSYKLLELKKKFNKLTIEKYTLKMYFIKQPSSVQLSSKYLLKNKTDEP